MLLLYSIVAGLLIGRLAGGRLDGLTTARFRLAPLALGGLLFQLVLFSPFATERVGDLGPVLYVASTAAVLVALLANLRLPGLWILAIGAGMNLVAIVANGGYMPADPEGVAALGLRGAGYTNSIVLTDPALPFLTDIFAMPAWMPAANIFSIGDVLLGIGVAMTIALAMRGTSPAGQSKSGSAGGAPDSTGAR
mgnify:CR=1 FL=1